MIADGFVMFVCLFAKFRKTATATACHHKTFRIDWKWLRDHTVKCWAKFGQNCDCSAKEMPHWTVPGNASSDC